MSKLLRPATVLATLCLAAFAPPARIDPARLAGFIDLYAPKAKARDYELRLAGYRGEAVRADYIVRRHGDWLRIERKGDGLAGVQQIHLPTGVIIEREAASASGGEYLNIRAPDPAPTPGIDYTSKPTRRSWKAAGEKCRIVEVYRGIEGGYTTFTRLGCMTRDGIEVARWTTGRTGADLGERVTGYYLYRGPMKDKEVRPSNLNLDVSGWLKPAPAAVGDEVVLKGEEGAETVTLRRRGGWTFSETVNPDGSRDMFGADGGGLTVSARIGPSGAPQSWIARRGDAPPPLPVVTIDEPGRVVQGRACAWYDAMPYAADAGRHECRTPDGLVLIIRKFARGQQTTLTATGLSERPLSDAELLPPAGLLDLRRWGVPD